MANYEVLARQRAGFLGFWRSGRWFSSEDPTVLSEDEMTDAIRSEPMLLVRETVEPPSSGHGQSEPQEQDLSGAELTGEDRPCAATTQQGTPCKRYAVEGSRFCATHRPEDETA